MESGDTVYQSRINVVCTCKWSILHETYDMYYTQW
jgi:hypothetical protein